MDQLQWEPEPRLAAQVASGDRNTYNVAGATGRSEEDERGVVVQFECLSPPAEEMAR
jgi:hypothetical protein